MVVAEIAGGGAQSAPAPQNTRVCETARFARRLKVAFKKAPLATLRIKNFGTEARPRNWKLSVWIFFRRFLCDWPGVFICICLKVLQCSRFKIAESISGARSDLLSLLSALMNRWANYKGRKVARKLDLQELRVSFKAPVVSTFSRADDVSVRMAFPPGGSSLRKSLPYGRVFRMEDFPYGRVFGRFRRNCVPLDQSFPCNGESRDSLDVIVTENAVPS